MSRIFLILGSVLISQTICLASENLAFSSTIVHMDEYPSITGYTPFSKNEEMETRHYHSPKRKVLEPLEGSPKKKLKAESISPLLEVPDTVIHEIVKFLYNPEDFVSACLVSKHLKTHTQTGLKRVFQDHCTKNLDILTRSELWRLAWIYKLMVKSPFWQPFLKIKRDKSLRAASHLLKRIYPHHQKAKILYALMHIDGEGDKVSQNLSFAYRHLKEPAQKDNFHACYGMFKINFYTEKREEAKYYLDQCSPKLNFLTLDLSSQKTEFHLIKGLGLDNLQKFRSLRLSIKKLSFENQDSRFLEQLTNLNSLDLQANDIGSRGLQAIKLLTNLSFLDLGNNELGLESPNSLKQLTSLVKLKTLNLRLNKLGSKHMNSFKTLTNVTSLDLHYNWIGGKGIQRLTSLKNLTLLDLTGNLIGKEGAQFLKSFPQLTFLYLKKNFIGDEGVKALRHLTKLVYLDLEWNVISNVEALKSLETLTWLNLSNNEIKDEGALALAMTLRELSYLKLKNNDSISEKCLQTIQGLLQKPSNISEDL